VPAGRNGVTPHGRIAEMHLSPSLTHAALAVLVPQTGVRRIYVSDLDTFTARPLTDGTMSIGYPAWSPDETRLAVEIKDGSSTHAAIVDVATGAVRRLTDERGQTWVRSWSPDGRRIAVAALRDGAWNLRWIDVASGRQGDITPPGPPRVYVRYPDWSRRGDLVVYERSEMRGNIWMLRPNQRASER
jgi:Tol biopolymer transport system component